MKISLSELIVQRPLTRFSSAVPLLTDVYVSAHSWNADDYIYQVYKRKRDYVINKLLILNINKKFAGNVIYKDVLDYHGDPDIDRDTGEYLVELDLDKSDVNLIELIQFMVNERKEIDIIPDELLIAAGFEPPKRNTTVLNIKNDKTDPAIATELGTLRNEKLKWDTSVRAATEIGILFFEGQLPKPTTRDAFVNEFRNKVGGLPDTTIEMIYKALPSEYRHKGGKPKVSKTETAAITGIGDLNTVIKAAVYAGSLHETRDAKDVSRLTTMLKEYGFQVPPVTVLEKIVEYVKDI